MGVFAAGGHRACKDTWFYTDPDSSSVMVVYFLNGFPVRSKDFATDVCFLADTVVLAEHSSHCLAADIAQPDWMGSCLASSTVGGKEDSDRPVARQGRRHRLAIAGQCTSL